jgi:cytochrome c-type biogenesis protein CcmF
MTHLALMLLFVGFTGKAFTSEMEIVLDRGETASVGNYELTYETMAFKEDANMSANAAALSLSRDGQRLGTLMPERRFYKAFEQGTTEVSIYSSLREDFYLILVGSADDNSTKFQVYINPLVNFVWLGSIVLVLGALWAMWPTARDRRMASFDQRASTESTSASQMDQGVVGGPRG